MNTAVDDHAGLACSAVITCPIQLSPASIEAALCWLVPAGPLGSSTENDGSVLAFASLMICSGGTTLRCCGPNSHSAKLGQIDHTEVDEYSFHDLFLASSRSK